MGDVNENSELFSVVRPYQWIFSLFAITPPPPLLFPSTNAKPESNYSSVFLTHRWLVLAFIGHSLMYLTASLYVTDVNNIVIDMVVNDKDLDCITRILSIASNVAVAVVQMIMQLSTVVGYRKLCCIYSAFRMLEQDIQWYCCHKSAPAGVCNFRRCVAAKSGLFFISCSTLLLYTNYHLVADKMTIWIKCLTIYFDLVIQMKCVEFCVMVQMVHELLRKLQRHLMQLQTSAVMCSSLMVQRLQINQNLVARIWNLVNAIESYFALPLLMLFLFNGLTITHTINWTYIQFTMDKYNIFRLFYTVVVLFFMLIPCWMSQACIDTYNEFGVILHNLKARDGNVLFGLRLREYSLQLSHQKLLFSCGGFFDVNLKYFGAMSLAIATYVVILIQFKLQAESENIMGHGTTKGINH